MSATVDAMLRAGANDREIAAVCHASTTTVRRRRKALGIAPHRRGGPSLPGDIRAKVEAMLRDEPEASHREIARRCGCSQPTVTKIDGQMRAAHGGLRSARAVRLIDYDATDAMIRAGFTDRAIAVACEMRAAAVSRRRKALGVTIRYRLDPAIRAAVVDALTKPGSHREIARRCGCSATTVAKIARERSFHEQN